MVERTDDCFFLTDNLAYIAGQYIKSYRHRSKSINKKDEQERDYMSFLRVMIEFKWPFLLIEVVFLFGGIALIISGIQTRKKSKSTALISLCFGTSMTLVLLWVLFWTLIVGYNS